jgi:hypothetical protein
MNRTCYWLIAGLLVAFVRVVRAADLSDWVAAAQSHEERQYRETRARQRTGVSTGVRLKHRGQSTGVSKHRGQTVNNDSAEKPTCRSALRRG